MSIVVHTITNDDGELDRVRTGLREKAAGKEAVTETEDTSDLHLTRDQFMVKMSQEDDGQSLLDLMQSGEWRICERMGLCNGYVQDDETWIDVLAWNNLVTHLRLVESVMCDENN